MLESGVLTRCGSAGFSQVALLLLSLLLLLLPSLTVTELLSITLTENLLELPQGFGIGLLACARWRGIICLTLTYIHRWGGNICFKSKRALFLIRAKVEKKCTAENAGWSFAHTNPNIDLKTPALQLHLFFVFFLLLQPNKNSTFNKVNLCKVR